MMKSVFQVFLVFSYCSYHHYSLCNPIAFSRNFSYLVCFLYQKGKQYVVCFSPHTCTLTLFSHSLSFHRSIRAAFYLDSSSEHFLLSEWLWKSRPLSLGSSEAMASRLSKTFRGPKAKYMHPLASVACIVSRGSQQPLEDKVLEAGAGQ